jgi:ABC-type multidrug transport system ATPase subunit/pSer/pThr/pTyr-binding forkhead associated (FHA) protein
MTLAGGTKLSRAMQANVPFEIGHAKSASLRIPHPSVSPVHCTVLWDGRFALLRDAGSQLGTKVNGRVIANDVFLRHGDQVSVGIFTVLFEWPGQTVADPSQDAALAEGSVDVPPATAEQAPPVPVLSDDLTVLFRGVEVPEVPVEEGLTLGAGDQADVRLADSALSPIHAQIERDAGGFVVVDLGRTGSQANGRYFERHPLVIGDLLQFGERHYFAFDGYALRRVRDGLGAGIQASGMCVSRGRNRGWILEDASFDARPGQFVGILGPSGAGKTTLLRALIGLRKLDRGVVLVDHRSLDEIEDLSRFFGYVPQQEIVHLELTGRRALRYSALLRLPRRTPREEIDKLIDALSRRLGLLEHLDTRAGQLSGGQLKRLSVCVELLNRPPLLFLDEPTSGLDPESETELMQHLQELSYTGCTVVCTTHLMENVYLMSGLEVVAAGRDAYGLPTSGRTVFRGKPRLAREHFDVSGLSKLYRRLRDKTPEEWQRYYLEKTGVELTAPPDGPGADSATPKFHNLRRLKRRPALPILLKRQRDILLADRKNLILYIGQPLLIAALIWLTATGDHPDPTKLFLAYIATLWLGCGNAAPEIVRERSIFVRERFVGLRPSSYLMSKFVFLGSLTILQAVLIFAVLNFFGSGLSGSAGWQLAGLVACALAATGLGLAISAWARTTLQAVLLVPVFIIPQILFSGYVFPVKDWDHHAFPRIVGRFFPSFAAQRIMDTSLFWRQPMRNSLDLEMDGLLTSYDNLSTGLRPWSVILNPNQTLTFSIDESAHYEPVPGAEAFGPREAKWTPDRNTAKYLMGVGDDERPRVFRHGRPAWNGLLSLMAWTIASAFLALRLLSRKGEE